MPWSGSGIFVPLGSPEFPAIPGEIIYAEYFNAVIQDLIDGLNNTLTRDGQEGPEWVDIPQIAPPAGPYTLPITARGKHIYKTDGAAITVPPNSSVAFPVGAVITLINFSAVDQDLLQGSGVSIFVPGSGVADDRVIPPYSDRTLLKVASDSWRLFVVGS